MPNRHHKYLTASGALLMTALVAAGCSSGGSTGTSTAAGGPGAGGPGGPGGGLQTFTAVNLNTNGESPGGANTAEVVAAVKAFLGTLDAAKLDKVSYDFAQNKERQTWSNFPSTAVAREGIVMSELTVDQQKAADAVLQVALSSAGAEQDADIRKSDDDLNSLGGQGADGFGSLKDYYIGVYGEPSTTQPFMIQFGGHHLARNLTYNGDKVSETPQFVGTEPVSFASGGTTVEPLKAESTAMFGVFAALTTEQRTAAKLGSGTYDDLLMGPGQDSGVFPASEGVLVSDLTDAQRKLVTAAIRSYVGDLADTAAARLLAKYESEYPQTKIAWANHTGPSDESSYLRIDGPSVWIEFINTRSQSTPDIHYHSVYRDKSNDYGSTKPG